MKCLKEYGSTALLHREFQRGGPITTSLSECCPTNLLIVSVGEYNIQLVVTTVSECCVTSPCRPSGQRIKPPPSSVYRALAHRC